jgi:hypothetical protein
MHGYIRTINPAIAVLIRLPDHLVDLIVGELLTDAGHDMPQLGSADKAIVVAIKDLESLANFLLGVGVLHLAGHHGEELGEVDGAVIVGVDLVDHVLEFGLAGVLAEGAHDRAQLFGGDLSWALYVSTRSVRMRHRWWVLYHRRLCPMERG